MKTAGKSMTPFRRFLLSVTGILLLLVAGCASWTQMHRDDLRFRSIKRGTEKYQLTTKDSHEMAAKRSEQSIKLYGEYVGLQTRHPALLAEYERVRKENEGLSKQGGVTNTAEKALPPDEKALLPDGRVLPPEGFRRSQIEVFWPAGLLKQFPHDNAAAGELIRALSSTSSIAQMRDLLTEPSLPDLLPIERSVDLACLPPPDSAAFDALGKMNAYFQQDKNLQAGLSGEFGVSAVKLFEESERTLFLQYALFRLCEMAINAPSGFRNVYPVIIHDIVRRTAEMNQLATREAEARRTEAEKTAQKALELKVKQQEAKAKRESAYFDCLRTKGPSEAYTDNAATRCKQVVEKLAKE